MNGDGDAMLDPDVLTETRPRLELIRRLLALPDGRALVRLLSDHDEEVRLRVRTPQPAPAHWHDAELADGTPSMVPSWPLEVVAPSVGITAWTGGVDIDGAYHEGAALDDLERDALHILAAVAAARDYRDR